MELTFLLILLAVLGTFSYASVSAAPWVPIRSRDVRRALDLAQIQPGERLYDLGCGDGRIVFGAGARGAKGVGFEISLLPYSIGKIRQLISGSKRGRILYRDLWRVSLADADIVYVFLMPKMYPRLQEKFLRELSPQTRIIAHAWPFPGWVPEKIDDEAGRLKLYRYRLKTALNTISEQKNSFK